MKAAVTLLVLLSLGLSTLPASADDFYWCWDADYFTTSVSDGVITVTHHNTIYNCCPDYFEYSVDQQGNVINVFEHEVLSMPCWCYCCYDLPVEIGPVEPGEYTIDFAWEDYESGARHVILDVVVEDDFRQGSEIGRSVIVYPPECIGVPPAAIDPGSGEDRLPGAESVPLEVSTYPNPTCDVTNIELRAAPGGSSRF